MIKIKYFSKKYLKISVLLILLFICIFKITDIVINESKEVNSYVYIDESGLESKLINQKDVIVYFYKNNCSPCNKFKDTLNKVIENEDYTIYGINIEENRNDALRILEKYDIKYTPTVVVYKNGKEQNRIEEMISYEKLTQFFNKSRNKKGGDV